MVKQNTQGATEMKVMGPRTQERNRKCREHLKVKDVLVVGLKGKY